MLSLADFKGFFIITSVSMVTFVESCLFCYWIDSARAFPKNLYRHLNDLRKRYSAPSLMFSGSNKHFGFTDRLPIEVASAKLESMSEPAALTLIECSLLLDLTNVQQHGGSFARPAFQPVMHVSYWYGCRPEWLRTQR